MGWGRADFTVHVSVAFGVLNTQTEAIVLNVNKPGNIYIYEQSGGDVVGRGRADLAVHATGRG